MHAARRLLLSLYYHGSLPRRRQAARRRAQAGCAPMTVLYYHRIADDGAGAWTYPTRLFVRQVRWLQRHFELISLAELQRRLRGRDSRRPAVSITFDDGYADNCQDALPLLVEARIPCTYFVCSEHAASGAPFAHDLARGQAHRPNSMAQLRALAGAGVEIGSHTRTHADLGTLDDPGRLYEEVVQSRQELEAALQRPVRYFAFPFGQYANLNPQAFHLARQAGYEGVCSAYGGYNVPGDDPFHIQRVAADHTMIRLKNWTTIDPRKLNTPRYDYRPAESCLAAGV